MSANRQVVPCAGRVAFVARAAGGRGRAPASLRTVLERSSEVEHEWRATRRPPWRVRAERRRRDRMAQASRRRNRR